MAKHFKKDDKVIVIGKYEDGNYWTGILTNVDDTHGYLLEMSVELDDLEYYDDDINWTDFYRNKYPNTEFWEQD